MSNSVPGKLFFVVIKESDNLRWKYLRFNPSGYKDIGIRKFEFVTKTQFLSIEFVFYRDWMGDGKGVNLGLHFMFVFTVT